MAWWLSQIMLGFLTWAFVRVPGLTADRAVQEPFPFMSACAALVTLVDALHSFAMMRTGTNLLRLGDDLSRTSKRIQKDSGLQRELRVFRWSSAG